MSVIRSSNDGDSPGYQDLSRTPESTYGNMGESTGRRTQSRPSKPSPTVSHIIFQRHLQLYWVHSVTEPDP